MTQPNGRNQVVAAHDMSDKPLSIHIDASHKRQDLPEFDGQSCPKCKGPVETGFGLAGGGYGIYTFCTACEEIVSKSEVEE